MIENPDPEGAGLWIVDRDGSAGNLKSLERCGVVEISRRSGFDKVKCSVFI